MMSITIQKYSDRRDHQFEKLLCSSPSAMFTHSSKFQKFLTGVLTDAEAHYLSVSENDQLIALLPLFIKDGPLGKVLNSLPFFGSHGGLVYNNRFNFEKCNLLWDALDNLAKDINAFSCTLIESPREECVEYYDTFSADYFDERIGQFTALPELKNEAYNADQELINLYHQKTRNMVRKGQKSGFDISHDGSVETLRALHSMHKTNIEGLGGQAKTLTMFQNIRDTFTYDKEFRIYTARKNNQIVSALLLFYFKDTVEYFTPATLEEYRSDQPLSALIHRAMVDAVLEKGMRAWNWGGTWLSQKGVYRFKSRWNAHDRPYKYHTKVYSNAKNLEALNAQTLLDNYRNFYTIPFAILASNT